MINAAIGGLTMLAATVVGVAIVIGIIKTIYEE